MSRLLTESNLIPRPGFIPSHPEPGALAQDESNAQISNRLTVTKTILHLADRPCFHKTEGGCNSALENLAILRRSHNIEHS